MVRRIRGDRRGAKDSREMRSGFDGDGMHAVVPAVGLIVVDAARLLRRDVLYERAAECDVDDLCAATDRERWDASLVGFAGQCELVAVAPVMRRARFGVRGLSKTFRVEVFTTGEH